MGVMRTVRRWVLVAVALAMGAFLLVQRQLLANPADERRTDRESIKAVLRGQQTAWDRGDVDAVLARYRRSPELTYSASRGASRGWDGVRPRRKKNSPDRR